MASKSLTLKFGADTSKLSKALKRMRQRITGAVSGAFSAATSLRGLAVAGVGGFGLSKLVGMMMNLSPDFANAVLQLKEPIAQLVTVLAENIAPYVKTLAEFLSSWLGRATSAATNQVNQSGATMSATNVGFSVRSDSPARGPNPFGLLFAGRFTGLF